MFAAIRRASSRVSSLAAAFDAKSAYSITLSARPNNAGGTVTPIALAVLRLITSSNCVGCSTGMSATLTPCKILTVSRAVSTRMLVRMDQIKLAGSWRRSVAAFEWDSADLPDGTPIK